jgi:hypothetical protein
VIVIGALTYAQQGATPPAAASQIPDISGIWTRLDLSGGGSYGGVSAQFPRAQLLPAAAAKVPKPVAEEDLNGIATTIPVNSAPTGKAYLTPDAAVALANGVEPEGRCGVGGAFGTGIDIDSTAMALVQSKDEVLLTRDSASGGRHIYLDGRKHPANWIPNPQGHSVGHWENGTLVVNTIGLTPGVVGFGRGWREPQTEVTEVYKLAPDGKRLTITYTWNDPTIYVKPHVYSITFERGKPTDYILERWCDSSIPHPETYTSIVPPVQR